MQSSDPLVHVQLYVILVTQLQSHEIYEQCALYSRVLFFLLTTESFSYECDNLRYYLAVLQWQMHISRLVHWVSIVKRVEICRFGLHTFLLLLMEDIESFLSNKAKVQVKSLVSKIKFRFVTSKVISIITWIIWLDNTPLLCFYFHAFLQSVARAGWSG